MLRLSLNYYNPYTLSFNASKKTADAKKASSIDDSDYHPNIKAAMKRIAKEPVEHGILFARSGRLIKETIGDKQYPFRSEQEEEDFNKLAEQYPGHIFLHNHPNLDKKGNPLPITYADAFKAAYHDASEAIAVHPDETFSSVKCLPNEDKFNGSSCYGFRYLLYELVSENNVDKYNEYGKCRDELWRQNEKELGIIYTNTYNY